MVMMVVTPVCIFALTWIRFFTWVSCMCVMLVLPFYRWYRRSSETSGTFACNVFSTLGCCHSQVTALFSFPFFLNPFLDLHPFASHLVSCSCREIAGLAVKLSLLPEGLCRGILGPLVEPFVQWLMSRLFLQLCPGQARNEPHIWFQTLVYPPAPLWAESVFPDFGRGEKDLFSHNKT